MPQLSETGKNSGQNAGTQMLEQMEVLQITFEFIKLIKWKIKIRSASLTVQMQTSQAVLKVEDGLKDQKLLQADRVLAVLWVVCVEPIRSQISFNRFVKHEVSDLDMIGSREKALADRPATGQVVKVEVAKYVSDYL